MYSKLGPHLWVVGQIDRMSLDYAFYLSEVKLLGTDLIK